MNKNTNEQLLSFIESSPSAWHSAHNLAKMLTENGYTELQEHEPWRLEAGCGYFVRRNGSTLLAFRLPAGAPQGFMLYFR